MINFRAPALREHPAMRLEPGWNFERVLRPVRNGCLVAPFQKPRHHLAVCARHHEGAHRRVILPQRPRPKRKVRIGQQGNREVPGRCLGLPRRAQRVEREDRQIVQRPYAKPRDRYQRHGGFIAGAYQREISGVRFPHQKSGGAPPPARWSVAAGARPNPLSIARPRESGTSRRPWGRVTGIRVSAGMSGSPL